jgi:predicted permease
MLLTLGGGLLGLLLASFGIDLLRNLGTDRLPLGTTIAFDARLAAISLVTALVVGLGLAVPVIWFNLHTRLAAGLQSETRNGTTTRAVQRLRHAFIILQIALAFVLLSGSALLGLSLKRVLAAPVGFSADSLLSGRLLLPWKNYPGEAAQLAFAERLLLALQTLPGVTQAAISTGLPFSDGTNDNTVNVEGAAPSADHSLHAHYLASVSADYWRMMQIPLLRGRLLEEADSHRPARVCVVDRAFAERYWPGLDPIGRRLTANGPLDESNAVTVVGVVGEVKQHDLAEQSGHGAVYFPHSGHSYLFVLIRGAIPPARLAEAVRKAVLQLDPNLPIYDLRPLQTRIDDSLVARRSPAVLASIFAAVALLLSAIGTYGVLAYAVNQRRREIGVRMALGALPQQILAQFLALGARLLVVGLALGLLGSWLAGFAMERVLFGTGAMNIAVLAATAGLLLAVVFLALFLPARRAAQLNPTEAIRAE